MRLAGRSTLLGAALLVPQFLAAQMIHGTITNAVTGYPVASVAVSLVDSANVVAGDAPRESARAGAVRGAPPPAHRAGGHPHPTPAGVSGGACPRHNVGRIPQRNRHGRHRVAGHGVGDRTVDQLRRE